MGDVPYVSKYSFNSIGFNGDYYTIESRPYIIDMTWTDGNIDDPLTC
jgi:hypothetical protein